MPEFRPSLLDSRLLPGDAYLVNPKTLALFLGLCGRGRPRPRRPPSGGHPERSRGICIPSVHLCLLRGQAFGFVKLECLLPLMKITDIAIVAGARTPMGRYCEKLRDFTPMELG